MAQNVPTLGVRAVFDISDVQKVIDRHASLMDRAAKVVEIMAERSNKAMRDVDRAFEIAERSGENFDRVMNNVADGYTMSINRMIDAQRQLLAQEQLAEATRAKFTYTGGTMLAQRLGVLPAVGADAQRASQDVKELAESEEEAADSAEEADRSLRDYLAGLRAFRWQLITIIFTVKLFTRAIQALYKETRQQAEDTSAIRGVQALAAAYGVNLNNIVEDLRLFGVGAHDTLELVRASQTALLADQGQFADQYGKLWQAATLTANVTGIEATKVLEGLAEALATGSAEAADSVTPIFDMADALEQYAIRVGKTVDELSDLERQQVMFQQVQRTTDSLIASGAQTASESIDAMDELGNAWNRFIDAVINGEEAIPIVTALTDALDGMADMGLRVAAAYRFLEQLKFAPGVAIREGRALTEVIDDMADAQTRWYEERRRQVFELPTPGGGFGGDGLGVQLTPAEQAMQVRREVIERVGDQLERGINLVRKYYQNVEKERRKYHDRLERLELDYRNDLSQIDRRFDQRRDRAIRRARSRYEAAVKESNDRIAQMTEQHYLQMAHLRQRHDLSMIQNERIYQYERRLLVGEGDVLAIEDLDARHALEQQAAEENFQLQLRQMEEMFQLQLKYAQEANRDMVKQLKDALDEELREIEEQRREEKDERGAKYAEQLSEARLAYEQNLEELETSLNEQLAAIGAGMQKQVEAFEEGYGEVEKLIDQIFGPTGHASQVLDGFLERYSNITIGITTYVTTGQFPSIPMGGGRGAPKVPTGSRSTLPTSFSRSPFPMTPISGGDFSVSWAGDGIPINVTGAEGVDLTEIGGRIGHGLAVELDRVINNYYGQRGR